MNGHTGAQDIYEKLDAFRRSDAERDAMIQVNEYLPT